MNIVMMTNTYLPHVGGVARSVDAFSTAYRQKGHNVLVVAPEFKGAASNETDVVRVPAMQNFNGSDFSVILPISTNLSEQLDAFEPDIIHSHHPFLMGSTALRISSLYHIPLVFTHHTMYEQYTHYVPGDSQRLKRFVIELATQYANLCHQVIVPSESIADVIRKRGVDHPIAIVPTGVDVAQFTRGSGAGFRSIYNIAEDAFVLGHLGRLAPEKNLVFLAKSAVHFIRNTPNTYLLLVGTGRSKDDIDAIFADAGLSHRLISVGVLEQPLLASAYQAMDLFLFSSQSETQGMVITEAMAAGTPVIALDAPGIREVVVDKINGRLLENTALEKDFSEALHWFFSLPQHAQKALQQHAVNTSITFSLAHSVDKALALYTGLLGKDYTHRHQDHPNWSDLLSRIHAEWELIKGFSAAASTALSNSET